MQSAVCGLQSANVIHRVKGPFHRVYGRDPFNQNSNRSDLENWSTSKGGPVFSKLFWLDRTDPLSFGPKFPENLVEWMAPYIIYPDSIHGGRISSGGIPLDFRAGGLRSLRLGRRRRQKRRLKREYTSFQSSW